MPGFLPVRTVGLKGDVLATYTQRLVNDRTEYMTRTYANTEYITVSSKLNDGVNRVFNGLIRTIYHKRLAEWDRAGEYHRIQAHRARTYRSLSNQEPPSRPL